MKESTNSIYHVFNGFTPDEIDAAINSLSDDDKILLMEKYGTDFHKPLRRSFLSIESEERIQNDIFKKIENILYSLNGEKKGNSTSKIFTYSSGVDIQSYLMEALSRGKTNKEIKEELNIGNKELYRQLLRLKNMGLNYVRNYYEDASIEYKMRSKVKAKAKLRDIAPDERTIIMSNKSTSMKFLLISDLHFGSELERPDLVDRAFNYCVKNGINIILCGGDLIDGTFSKGPKKIDNVYEQVEYFLKRYPSDPNIITFSVGGDHDHSTLKGNSVDIKVACENYRHDIIIGGYNNMDVNIKKSKIHLYHHIMGGSINVNSAPIILHGHSHTYGLTKTEDKLHIAIPALSQIRQPMPSVVELNVELSNGVISKALIKHILLGNTDVVLGASECDFHKKTIMPAKKPKQQMSLGASNIDRDNPRDASTEIASGRLSQIEKFNKRYGLK